MLMTRGNRLTSVWDELWRLQREMDRLFESFGSFPSDGGWPRLAVAYPPLAVWQDENNVYAEAELPGMELSDLEIYVTGGNQLTIKGERKQPALENGVWHRQERGFGSFTRIVTLPVSVDTDRVEARLVHGVLTLTMPKAEEARPRKIAVKVG
jgi:HSP20 family protein